MSATFDYIPVIQDTSVCELAILRISGISTKEEGGQTDRGRLYCSVTQAGGVITVGLYAGFNQEGLILSGTTDGTGKFINLTGADDLQGIAYLKSFAGDATDGVAFVTFATDEDVDPRAGALAVMPGNDADLGLAAFHARAMREILANDLPAQVPHLYPAGRGIANFAPGRPGVLLPDISQLANVDGLRMAQACLVKALSFETEEHLEEPAAVAKLARERYQQMMDTIGKGNVADEEQPHPETEAQISVFEWGRM